MAFDGLKRLSQQRVHIASKPTKFTVHGSFKSKTDAVTRERETKGAFIVERQTKQGKRFIVLVNKGR